MPQQSPKLQVRKRLSQESGLPQRCPAGGTFWSARSGPWPVVPQDGCSLNQLVLSEPPGQLVPAFLGNRVDFTAFISAIPVLKISIFN